jgi:hypothetical protein
MEQIRNFIDLVGQGDNVGAKDALSELLASRAFESLESKKHGIAGTLFNTEEVEDLDESGFNDTLAPRGAFDKDHHPQWSAATKDWQKAHPKYNKERTKDIKSQIKGRIGRGDYAKKSNLPEEVEE